MNNFIQPLLAGQIIPELPDWITIPALLLGWIIAFFAYSYTREDLRARPPRVKKTFRPPFVCFVCFVVALLSASAQTTQAGRDFAHYQNDLRDVQNGEQREREDAYLISIARAQAGPLDPWRKFGDAVVFVGGPNWYEFTGTVLQSVDGGIRVRGYIGVSGPLEFFVAHYPYPMADKELLPTARILAARDDGVYHYDSVGAGVITIRKLDYGTPSAPPQLTPEQADALRAQQAANRVRAAFLARQAATNTVKFLETQAALGSATAQASLGLRLLHGDAVAADPARGRALLEKAAAQGSAEAKAALAKLPSQ